MAVIGLKKRNNGTSLQAVTSKILALHGFNTVAGLQKLLSPLIDAKMTQMWSCRLLHNRRPLCMGRTGGSLIAGNYG